MHRNDNQVYRTADVFKELIGFCFINCPEVILRGAMESCSIVGALAAVSYINNGASFIVGPLLDEETALLCNKRKIPYSLGCATLTEINRALSPI